jgi:2-oxoglutarate dehydrogenase E1 component
MWVQEEPKNQGAWTFVQPRLKNILKHIGKDVEAGYSGRATSASTATGYHHYHDEELKSFLNLALK